MEDWVNLSMKYPPNWIQYKENDKKTADALDRICSPLFPYHTQFRSVAHDYKGSVVLIGNENCIPHMITEAAQFGKMLDVFYSKIATTNSRQETAAYYKQFKLKSKDILAALIDDIKGYAEMYSFQVDVKYIVDTFNQCKNEYVPNHK